MKTMFAAGCFFLAAAPALVLADPAAEGLQLFVAPDGDDANAGTLTSPLATIHAARDRIRAIKAGPGLPSGGVTVSLRGGEYVLNAVEFDPLLGRRPGSPNNNGSAAAFRLEREDSGTVSSPIVYGSHEGEQATLVRGPDVDFRVSLIINQADQVFFKGIDVRGGRSDWMNRPSVSRVAAADGGALQIVVDGRARATVVIADEPSGVARYAAEELVEHVRKATGATLPVVHETATPPARGGHHRIFLGDTAAARRAGLQPETLAPEAFVLKTADGDLYVVGRESDEDPLSQGNPWVGTLHGLYEILERSLAVRWLWPGELGTFIPRTTTVVIAPVNEVAEPPLRYRTWSTNRDIASTAVFLRRHGMGGGQRPYVSHFVQEWWNIYGQEHPEWFALNAEGKRVGPTLCVSNPELRRHLADFRSRPEHTPTKGVWARGTKYDDVWNGSDVISLSEADSTEYCRCEACAALDAPHPAGLTLRHVWMRRVLADRYAHLWRAVFERARRINPDVCVTTFLYWQTFHAPLGEVHLGERYHGEFVPWMAKAMWFPMPDDAYRHLEEQWLGWKKTGITMAYRPNYFHGGHGLPFLSTRQSGAFLRFAYEHGSRGWAGDSLFNHWATQGPMLYVHMRLLKDPTMSVDEARAEYFSGFGPAAEPIERYFDAWENFSHKVVNKHVWPRWGVDQLTMAPRIFTPDVFATTGKILDEALTAAGQDAQPEYAQRVEFIRRGLDHAKASIKFLGLLDGGAVVLDDRDRFEATRQAWRELQQLRTPSRVSAEATGGIVLDYDLHVGRYPVTHDQYHAFCQATGRPKRAHPDAAGKADAGRYPITGNTWADYAQYCNWLSTQAGLEPAYVRDETSRGGWILRAAPEQLEGYRMPLQSEWEYAARGGAEADISTTYAGSSIADDVAWTGNTSGLQPVGKKKPNALGLHDMSGLVNEWVTEGHLLGGSYYYPPQQAAIYPKPRQTIWAGPLDAKDDNQSWHSSLRVVRTAIGDGSPIGACPEMVLVRAGATIGNPLPVVDLAALSGNESRYLKNLDALEKDFEAVTQTPPPPTPWSEWRFRTDRDNRGLEEGWQRGEFDAAAWKPIRVPAAWSRTWVGKLVGYGWYRTTFMFPADWAGEPVQLQFGGVDEQAWVYVNGELVGEQLAAGPFTVEVPAKLLQPGVQNTLVVRVHNTSGDGGILEAVSGAVPHPENRRPLPNGS